VPKSVLQFRQILAWLMTEVMFGRAHFSMTRSMGRRDRTLIRDAIPGFFNLTLGAHADCAQLAAARIFDKTGDASIHTLISSALKEASNFKYGTPSEVRKAVDEARATVAVLSPVVTAVRLRRNKTMAHIDASPIMEPGKYMQAGRISYGDIQGLFNQVEVVLNRFSVLYRGVSVPLELEEAKTYEQALDLIAEAIRAKSGP